MSKILNKYKKNEKNVLFFILFLFTKKFLVYSGKKL